MKFIIVNKKHFPSSDQETQNIFLLIISYFYYLFLRMAPAPRQSPPPQQAARPSPPPQQAVAHAPPQAMAPQMAAPSQGPGLMAQVLL